ncbi:unnamed protein product, partial [Rotaria sp. Silwood2]
MFSWQAWLAASAVIMVLLCINLIFHQYVYRVVMCGVQMRVAYTGLIFRKVLRLSSHAMNNFSSGEITNLLANDANKVELVHYFLNYLWVAPLQIIAVVFVLWQFVYYVTFIAIGYTLLLLLIQPLFSRLFLHLRTEVLKTTDERIKIMSEIIKSMRIDFVQLSHGENTLVGDQGVMLSGGQKARVNIARALYRDADIYLLDDPLSAVDAKVSKHLFDKSIKNYLRDKIRILVTHQIQFLQDATKIIILDNGEMVQMGTYEELLVSSPLFAQLLEDINQHEQEQEQQQPISLLNQQSMIGSINSENDNIDEENMNSLTKNLETKQEGTVKWNVYVLYIRSGIGVILGFLLIIILFATQQSIAIYSNWWLVAWTNDESHRYHQNSTNCVPIQDKKIDRIYRMNSIEWNTYRDRRFYIFCVFVFILCFLIFLRTVVSQLIFLNAGRVLHNKMFKRVIRCPISFFDTNPVGRILNRFTSDIATMDESLPMTVFDFLVSLSQVLGTIVLVIFLNPWSFISAIIAASGMLFVRYRFAPCSRDLKRLVGTTRSPVYSQLTSTIHGLKVIRSY